MTPPATLTGGQLRSRKVGQILVGISKTEVGDSLD
jgi:hypothetical protein